jgi:serine/threonine protein kinase
MSSILIVEHEGRYIERIQDALTSEGWQPRFVAGRPEALRAAASEEPSLVLINAELPGAPELLRTFARRNGGPGSVALVAEHVGDDEAGRLEADEVLSKPFTDQDLRLVVRRGLSRTRDGGRGAAPVSREPRDGPQPDAIPVEGLLDDGGDMLTSADIFGDVLAEVEAEVDGEAGDGGDESAAAARAREPQAPRAARPSRDLEDPEMARRLEQTLSGVLGPRKPKPAASADDEATAARKRRARTTDVDELLNLTLSSLDEPPKKKRQQPPGAHFADLDLSEIEALASGVRRKPRPEAPAAAPPAAAPAPGDDPDPGEASWADIGRAVGDPPPPGAAEPAAAPPDEVERFGHYALLERIAVGGMAEVWKARMRGVEGFQKTVAIKKILPQMTDNAEFVTMFIDEAKLAAQLNHPNITHIYDLGKIGREHYIAMEFVEGLNLRSVLNQARAKGRPLPIGLALLIGARLASALDYAHRKRDFDGKELELVHRDVSPQNVLLAYEGDIKLCDFGIVKAVTKASHTQMGALKGKLQYMSPEQAWGQAVDSRSDIFSLGSLLFEMLTGDRLFAGDNEISVLDAVRECQIRSPREINPAVPEQADAVVLKALAKQPVDRYGSAGEMQSELEEILYRLKPTPGQADLADYLRSLDAAPALDDSERAEFSWAAASSPPQTAGAPEAPAEAVAAPEDEEIELIFEDEDDDLALAEADEEDVVELLEIEGDPAVGVSVLPDDDFGGAATQPVPVFEEPPELPERLGNDGGAAQAEAGEATGGESPPEIGDVMAALAARGSQAAPAEGAVAVPPPPALPPDRGDDTGTLDRTGDRTGEKTSVPALAPSQAKVDLEEGGRGRWMLIAAIVLVIVLGVAAWFLFFSNAAPAPTGEPVEPPVASEPAAQPPAGEPEPADAAPAAAAAGETADATADEGEDEAAEGGEAGVAYEDLQDIVDQEMAKREEAIRREQDERVRRLESQLREAQAEAARARAAEEPPADGGDGDDAP